MASRIIGSPATTVLKGLRCEPDRTKQRSVMPNSRPVTISCCEIARSLRESRFFVRQRSGVGLDSFVRLDAGKLHYRSISISMSEAVATPGYYLHDIHQWMPH